MESLKLKEKKQSLWLKIRKGFIPFRALGSIIFIVVLKIITFLVNSWIGK